MTTTQPLPRPTTLPRMASRAVPHLVVVAVMPTVWFLVGRSLWGLAGGVGLALAWNLGCQASRWARGQAFSTLLVLNLAGLVLRSALAVGLHSARLYFIAPALFTAGTGAAYFASAFTPTPLLTRVLSEFIPHVATNGDQPGSARILRKCSLFYGVEQLTTSIVSIGMVFQLSTTTYAAIHPVVSWLVLGACVAIALPIFWKDLPLVRSIHLGRSAGSVAERLA